MKDRLGRAANQWEILVNTPGAIQWQDIQKSQLHPHTHMWLTFMEDLGLVCHIASQTVFGTQLFKVSDDLIRYVVHDQATRKHMYAGEGFHEAIDPDTALVHLAHQQFPHMSEAELKDILARVESNG